MPRKTDAARLRASAPLSQLLAAAMLAMPLAAQAAPPQPAPDFGPSVHILHPATPGLQQRILDIYEAQQPNHFGPRRDAILLMPGTYENLRIPVGFYTHVLGLGRHPGDVHVIGELRANAFLDGDNATQNFWRGAENFAVTPSLGLGNNTMQWAVSQASSSTRTMAGPAAAGSPTCWWTAR
jgi:hypothetical protein